eukprot:EG_transcript_35101
MEEEPLSRHPRPFYSATVRRGGLAAVLLLTVSCSLWLWPSRTAAGTTALWGRGPEDVLVLSSGIRIRYIAMGPPPRNTPRAQPFVLFVHGTFHGAWCWAEHWQPWLARQGVASVALNLRGTAGAPLPLVSDDDMTPIKLSDCVQDVVEAAHLLTARFRRPAVLAGHSLGGLVALKALEQPALQR